MTLWTAKNKEIVMKDVRDGERHGNLLERGEISLVRSHSQICRTYQAMCCWARNW